MTKIVALFVVLTVVFSFSQESFSVPMEKLVVYDTIHRLDYDSLTIALLKESHSFYSTSFYTFIAAITVLIALAIVILGYLNSRKEEEIRKELEKTKKNIEEELEELKNKLENELTNQLEDKLENDKKLLEENYEKIFREIGYSYFSLAISFFESGKYKEHFRRLAEYYYVFTTYKIKPRKIDIQRLIYFDKFIKKYNNIFNNIKMARIFLYELDRFIKYCEANKEGEPHSREANNIELMYLKIVKGKWEKICNKFGGKDTVKKAIENYIYDFE
ncbi:MAG: hypothetical protein LBC75_01435 [Fibromonadaceae bacterium]|nr:hypothetical protein [Fibromonadaceae bacterium]